MPARALAVATLVLVAVFSACKREERDSRPQPVAERAEGEIVVSGLYAGEPPQSPPAYKEYEESAYHVSQGQQLFSAMNCVGCHANGGGGMGPPLMDDVWIYGSEPQNIYATIVEGRPNGMPSFRGKIPEQQVWELVAYVRSMSGLLRQDVPSARSDHMSPYPSATQVTPATPQNTGDRPSTLGTAQ
jgi:cytochrome c oxidase cbb3-type subunit III